MAITLTLLSVEPERIKYLLQHDGTDTDSATVANATLIADMAGTSAAAIALGVPVRDANHSPLLKVFSRPGAGGAAFGSQAAARLALTEGGPVTAQAIPRGAFGGAAASWAVDVSVDGNGAPTVLLNSDTTSGVTQPAAILEIVHNHSQVR